MDIEECVNNCEGVEIKCFKVVFIVNFLIIINTRKKQGQQWPPSQQCIKENKIKAAGAREGEQKTKKDRKFYPANLSVYCRVGPAEWSGEMSKRKAGAANKRKKYNSKAAQCSEPSSPSVFG